MRDILTDLAILSPLLFALVLLLRDLATTWRCK